VLSGMDVGIAGGGVFAQTVVVAAVVVVDVDAILAVGDDCVWRIRGRLELLEFDDEYPEDPVRLRVLLVDGEVGALIFVSTGCGLR
jgi:hypothetical protein